MDQIKGNSIVNNGEIYKLRLFIVGNEAKSRQAQDNLHDICNRYLSERCEIEIIDILENFQAALDNNIFVTPALVMVSPRHATIFGSLSDRDSVLEAMHIKAGE